jgi:hypothetical protein
MTAAMRWKLLYETPNPSSLSCIAQKLDPMFARAGSLVKKGSVKRPLLIHDCFTENDTEICDIEAEATVRYTFCDDTAQKYIFSRKSQRICRI